MSRGTLSDDAIAALVEAAKDGRLPDQASTAAPRADVRKADFSRPRKFSPELTRRIRRAVEGFTRTAGARLSSDLRTALELEVIATRQLIWADAHAAAAEDCLSAFITVEPSGQMILAVEDGLVLGAIELLLGAATPGEVRRRRLTDVDWALGRHVLDRLTAQLAAAWHDVLGQELGLATVDLHAEAAQLLPVSEPTLSITFEARMGGNSHTIELLIPWSTVEPIAAPVAASEGESDAEAEAPIRRALGTVDVQVRAEVGAVEMPIEAVLALRPGDVITFDRPMSAGVALLSGDVDVYVAAPGRQGARRAVQIVAPAGEAR
jgi:flagellar motor switch protein FliM